MQRLPHRYGRGQPPKLTCSLCVAEWYCPYIPKVITLNHGGFFTGVPLHG